MGLSDILKKVVLPAAAGTFLGPMAGTGLKALGLTTAGSNPFITKALTSGIGSLVMGGKPKDALKSALLGGIGGTALQEKFPNIIPQTRTNVPVRAGTGSNILTGAFNEGMKKGVSPSQTNTSSSSSSDPSKNTLSYDMLKKIGLEDNFLGSILNSKLGEGLAAGLLAQLLAGDDDEDTSSPFNYQRMPFGQGGPGGQIGGIRYAAMGGPAMPQQISKPGFPRRDGAIMPYEGGGKVDDVPAMLTAGEFVLTKDAVKGLGNGNQNLGIQRAYDMMGNLEGMA
tara:strand:- start:3606 stop:4451 length:846 start_codon:yes stop_codon:yes gene_type:complete